MSDQPASVSVVIPTHNRPKEVRRAIQSVLEQDYEGRIEVIVVHDREDPDQELVREGSRPVRVLNNFRSPGLAGGRNSGILDANTDLVAFCDDDDYWKSGKLRRQAEEMKAEPDAPLVSSSVVVEYEGKSSVRKAGVGRVTHPMLVRSRMAMLHSSTLLFKRSALLGELGLISEDIPGSQNEDWDILLRSAALHPIVHVDEPLVHVVWGKASFFSRRWDTKIASSIWMLQHHPEIGANRKAAARVIGQIAFAHACSGNRRQAWRWAARGARRHFGQPRWLLSSAVAVWPRSGELVLGVLHRFGRGL